MQPSDETPKPNAKHEEATRFAIVDGHMPDEHDFDVSSSRVELTALQVLGEYLLLEQIGAGGMGRVFRAEHRTMNRQVALKVLSSDIASRPGLMEQFFSEVRAVGKLMHPNIVTAFDAGSIGEQHFLVMELVEGIVLSDRIREQGTLSGEQAANVLEQAAQALAYAHRQEIVHRDIKPGNLMLTTEGSLKILDFGLAMLGNAAVSLSQKNIFMGTPEYMSPEQIENPDSVDGRSDLYSLGATLFFLLTGRPMFQGDKMHVALSQLRQKPDSLYVARGDIDLRLDSVFQRLVAKSPDDRYSSAEELLSHLQELNLSAPAAKPQLFVKGGARFGRDFPTSAGIAPSTLAKKSQVVAIDLGMLVSTAAYFDTDLGPQIIAQGEGNVQHVRNMIWSSEGQIKFGGDAVAMRHVRPDECLHSLQRWIGAPKLNRSLAGTRTPPEVALAAFLRKMMANSSLVVDASDSAIVTVPGCYDQLHRRAIRTACTMAGINLVQLLDKPLAAALSWLDVNSRLSSVQYSQAIATKLLYVHVGGSSMEASILSVEGLDIQQLGVSGSWKQGSLRWQHRLTDYFVTRLRNETGKAIQDDPVSAARLQRTVELALDRLTRSSRVDVKFQWEGVSIEQTITQDGLVKIAPDLVQAIEVAIRGACHNASTDIGEIDHVLLAGSMLKMRPLQEIVQRCVPHRAGFNELEKADLARGAAIQAQHYCALTKSSTQPRAKSCTAYDFAVLATNTASGKASPKVLMKKSSPLPATINRTLRPSSLTERDSQAFPTLQLIESTSSNDSDWLALGRVRPDELFPNRGPTDPLHLRLEIDESGILESSLLWIEGNRQTHLPHTSDPSLSEAEIQSWTKWLRSTF